MFNQNLFNNMTTIPSTELKQDTYLDDGLLIVVPKGSVLFRAAETLEEEPTPRMCSNTDKAGVYFSLNSPYLAETMCTEYQKDLIVATYITTEDITAYYGKYSCFNRKRFKMNNIPHIDNRMQSLYSTIKPSETCIELFLTRKELQYIKYSGFYKMTFDECVKKWGFDLDKWNHDH